MIIQMGEPVRAGRTLGRRQGFLRRNCLRYILRHPLPAPVRVGSPQVAVVAEDVSFVVLACWVVVIGPR